MPFFGLKNKRVLDSAINAGIWAVVFEDDTTCQEFRIASSSKSSYKKAVTSAYQAAQKGRRGGEVNISTFEPIARENAAKYLITDARYKSFQFTEELIGDTKTMKPLLDDKGEPAFKWAMGIFSDVVLDAKGEPVYEKAEDGYYSLKVVALPVTTPNLLQVFEWVPSIYETVQSVAGTEKSYTEQQLEEDSKKAVSM